MQNYWYGYVKAKYGKKTKLCYIGTYSFIVHVKSEDIYIDVAGDVKKKFGASNYEFRRPLPVSKNRNKDWVDER